MMVVLVSDENLSVYAADADKNYKAAFLRC